MRFNFFKDILFQSNFMEKYIFILLDEMNISILENCTTHFFKKTENKRNMIRYF